MKTIIVYTDRNCIYCQALIQYLVINNIEFNEINIDDAPDNIKSIDFIPIIKINDIIIQGFDIDKINNYLGIVECDHDHVYLDNAASTKLNHKVFQAMKPYMIEKFANPSSIYSIGLENKDKINEVRKKIADILKCNKDEIFFTSGGSESNNMAIKCIASANKDRGNHIITSKIEHSSVLNACKWLETQGFEVTYLPVNKNGLISIEELKKSITDKTILISIMYANNEIGTIQDIEKIGEIAKKHNIYFHTDAVQAIGKIDINLSESNINILSLSGHKLYGPKGIGAIYIKRFTNIDSLIHGGNQQDKLRAGTESVANIVALGKALELSSLKRKENQEHIKLLHNKFILMLKQYIGNFKLNGHPDKRLYENISITLESREYLDNFILKFLLDTNRIYVSSGSACSETSITSSHVLKSIGLSDDECNRTIRFTLGNDNTQSDIEYTVNVISNIMNKLKSYYFRDNK